MTNPSALATTSPPRTSLNIDVRNVDDLQRLARLFAASGMFGGGATDRDMARCAIQLLAGMEAGFPPFAAISGIYVVNGKPGFSAQLLAQAIKKHPRYDYRVLEKTDKQCRIEFFQDGQSCGIETFSMAMAERAGLLKGGPWRQYPEAMLFARALTAGMRTHCPDALGGHGAYTPEELGARGQIDESGMVTVEDVTEEPAPVDRDQLQARAIATLKQRGVTANGMKGLLASAGVGAFGQLPDHALQQLADGKFSAEKVDRWNLHGVQPPEPEQDVEPLPEEEDYEEGAPLLHA